MHRLPLVVLCTAACGGDPLVVDGRLDPGMEEISPRLQWTDFGSGVEATPAPLPISGGTLLALADDHTIVASDPDLGRIWIVNLAKGVISSSIELNERDEPGRLVEDAPGRVRVLMRNSGDLVTIEVASGTLTKRQSICRRPRGIAHDPKTDRLHVACQEGLLISMESEKVVRTLSLPPDLRDVVVEDDHLWVSRFRSAEILRISSDGNYERIDLPDLDGRSPGVAWRMVAHPAGGIAVLHQLAAESPRTEFEYRYASDKASPPCLSPLVRSALTTYPHSWWGQPFELGGAALAVDVVYPRPNAFVVAAPSNAGTFYPSAVQFLENVDAQFVCTPIGGVYGAFVEREPLETVAVAYAGSAHGLVRQSRDPPGIATSSTWIPFPVASRAHVGHALFHRDSGGSVACANCHPEGGEDGRTWTFPEVGVRRTQTLRNGVIGTEPFHWNGEIASFTALVADVFTERMRGPELQLDQVESFSRWVSSIPTWPISGVDRAAAERGSTLFHDPVIGCSSCHSGPRLTNNQTVDVGTGGLFQVPSLVGVSLRGPWMHDGCATTLGERFTPSCGGSAHGATSSLSNGEIDDLIAYLESL